MAPLPLVPRREHGALTAGEGPVRDLALGRRGIGADVELPLRSLELHLNAELRRRNGSLTTWVRQLLAVP
eukprot:12716193-Alexandrium_andersonii.AAC.1